MVSAPRRTTSVRAADATRIVLPLPGGHESSSPHLYHAIARIGNTFIPGKTSPALVSYLHLNSPICLLSRSGRAGRLLHTKGRTTSSIQIITSCEHSFLATRSACLTQHRCWR
jgi:hypothetical protein